MRKLTSLLLLACAGLMAQAVSPTSLWPADVTEARRVWRSDKFSSWSADESGTPVLKVEVPASETDRTSILGASRTLDLRPYRGKDIQVTVESRHLRLTEPSKSWLGFKLMLEYVGDAGVRVYPGGGNGVGTPRDTDWRTVSFTTRVHQSAEEGILHLGCQDATGTLWFRNLRVRVVEMYPEVAPLPEGFRCEYSDAVRGFPVLRGVMSPGLSKGAKAEDLEELARWGANVIRWQVNLPNDVKTLMDVEAVREIFRQHLKNLDVHLPLLRKAGIHVIFDFHGVPGGRVRASKVAGTAGTLAGNVDIPGNHFWMFHDRKYLDAFVELWRMVAEHYKDEPIVFGYDLYNEPVQSTEVAFDYLYCQYEAAKAIRAIDPEKPIIIAANQWSSPDAFKYLRPLPLRNLIYQGHMYMPGSYTHQGVGGDNMKRLKENPALLKGYPGVFDGRRYDKETLRACLKPIRDFQLKYGARIYIGEFSAIRFAPGACQYLADLTSIFEEYGWDWSYHAFREWFNWSVEYDGDIHNEKPATSDTDRKRLLLELFRKNVRRTY